MPSSKGNPTNPELREKIKNDIQSESPGGWAAWKAAKLSKEYEAQGGEYENEPGSKNQPKKGAPEHKSEGEKKDEVKESEKKEEKEEKPKANSAKKAASKKGDSKPRAPKKDKKEPTPGTRKSSRISEKRGAPDDKDETKAPAKKAKTSKK